MNLIYLFRPRPNPEPSDVDILADRVCVLRSEVDACYAKSTELKRLVIQQASALSEATRRSIARESAHAQRIAALEAKVAALTGSKR